MSWVPRSGVDAADTIGRQRKADTNVCVLLQGRVCAEVGTGLAVGGRKGW